MPDTNHAYQGIIDRQQQTNIINNYHQTTLQTRSDLEYYAIVIKQIGIYMRLSCGTLAYKSQHTEKHITEYVRDYLERVLRMYMTIQKQACVRI